MQKEWEANNVLQTWVTKQTQYTPPGLVNGFHPLGTYNKDEPISIEQWKHTLSQTAQLIDRFGAGYLPFFLRVERELATAQKDFAVLKRVRQLSNNPLLNFESNLIQP